MLTETNRAESQALLANDIRVLVEQLNGTIKRGAEQGLKIQIEASNTLDVKSIATSYPVLSVRVQAEVH